LDLWLYGTVWFARALPGPFEFGPFGAKDAVFIELGRGPQEDDIELLAVTFRHRERNGAPIGGLDSVEGFFLASLAVGDLGILGDNPLADADVGDALGGGAFGLGGGRGGGVVGQEALEPEADAGQHQAADEPSQRQAAGWAVGGVGGGLRVSVLHWHSSEIIGRDYHSDRIVQTQSPPRRWPFLIPLMTKCALTPCYVRTGALPRRAVNESNGSKEAMNGMNSVLRESCEREHRLLDGYCETASGLENTMGGLRRGNTVLCCDQ
jgi:hypothetical protein